MARSRIVVPAVVLLLVSGCSARPPHAVPVPARVAATASASFEVDDPPGTNACQLLVDAVRAGTLMQPGVVDAIVRASATADAPVADAAHRLAAAYAAAVTAHASSQEPDAVAAVSAAGADLAGVCADSGLETVG